MSEKIPAFNDHGNALEATLSRTGPETEAVMLDSQQNPDERPKIGWRTWGVVALCFLAQYVLTFWAIAGPSNAYSIAGPLNGMKLRMWIAQAGSIPSIVTGPVMAIISDMYGRRYIVIGSYLVMAVAAVVQMTAQSMVPIVVGQALIGTAIGVQGIMFAIPSEILPNQYRAYAQTLLNIGASLSSVTALIVMGVAIKADPVNGWRWIFRHNLMGFGILLIGFIAIYHPPPRTQTFVSFRKRIATLDWIGYFLLLAGLVPLLMGFAWAGDRDYGWKSAHAYGPVAVGFVGFIACLLYEWKGRDDGFIHHELFRHGWNFPIVIWTIAIEGAIFYVINNIWSGQVLTLYSNDPIIFSLYLIPFFLVVAVLAPPLAYYTYKFKDVKWPIVAGLVFFLSGIIGFATATEHQARLVLLYNVLCGIGFTAPLVFIVSIVQLSTPPLFIGITTALTISARTLGGTIGFAIADAIYGSKTNTQVPEAIAGAVIPLGFNPANLGPLIGAVLSGQGLGAVPGGTGEIIGAAFAAAKHVQARGYRTVWQAFIPAVALAAIACCFLRNPKERLNWATDAPLQKDHSAAHAEADKEVDEAIDEYEKKADVSHVEHR